MARTPSPRLSRFHRFPTASPSSAKATIAVWKSEPAGVGSAAGSVDRSPRRRSRFLRTRRARRPRTSADADRRKRRQGARRQPTPTETPTAAPTPTPTATPEPRRPRRRSRRRLLSRHRPERSRRVDGTEHGSMRGRTLGATVSGQALVEFALVAPIFLFALMTLIEFGRAVYYAQMLHNAAREGARYAIVHGSAVVLPKRTDAGGRRQQLRSPSGIREADGQRLRHRDRQRRTRPTSSLQRAGPSSSILRRIPVRPETPATCLVRTKLTISGARPSRSR